ncbi:MAG: tRNA (guanosine(37)-N1)-methyltransferase TrmD [Bacillota bacterium]|nr:tRNA (guanosine(37)-N1)-methyltransferase TrmD [Bacillota bacterium]
MKFSILTLFPEAVSGFFDSSIIGRAKKQGNIEIALIQIRDFSADRHKKVDDAPFGGGAGMVMTVQPLKDALLSACASESGDESEHEIEREIVRPECEKMRESHRRRVLYMSPRGTLLTQKKCEELAQYDHLVLICGHYEGVDQRFIDRYVDEEISIGDYILTGGELAAAVLVDSVSRLSGGVLGSRESLDFESHASGLLEYPHYTRPEVYDGDRVPDILLSGHHQNIAEWRLKEAVQLTKERRPDLYRKYLKERKKNEQT